MNISNQVRQHVAFSAAGVVPFPNNCDFYLNYHHEDVDEKLERHIESLEPGLWESLTRGIPSPSPTWRVDGAIFGIRYFATPLFPVPDFPPLCIDVVVPDQLDWAPELWAVLGASDSVHIHDGKVASLGIARYLVFLLDHWCRHYPDFERVYRSLPFGSSIVVGHVGLPLSKVRVEFEHNIDLPTHLLSVDTLREMWNFQHESMPVAIDLYQLHFVKRLHSTICLVKHGDSPMIFKSGTSSPSSLYHEIKVMLSLPPHPNLVGPPRALVTIPSDAQKGNGLVCGFLLEYYEIGSMETFLPRNRDSLSRHDQLRWSLELVSALRHIHSQPGMFYSDLKMDNILLRSMNGKMSIVILDFEQSRNLYTWAPPEVFYVEWIAELSFCELSRNDGLTGKMMSEFRGVVERYFSSRGVALPLHIQRLDYDNPEHGWYYPWLTSTPQEQEAGVVYCLGRALWCIFEGIGNTSNVLGRSHPHDDDSQYEFPRFTTRTPDQVQKFIRRCTAGAREWTDDGALGLFRLGGKVFPRGQTGVMGQPKATVEETKEAVKKVWELEIVRARKFLLARERYDNGKADDNDLKLLGYLERPTLKEVHAFLEDLAATAMESAERLERAKWNNCVVS